jgi:hypothetical protein
LRRKGAFDLLPSNEILLVQTLEQTLPIAYFTTETPSDVQNSRRSLGIEIRLYSMENYLSDTEYALVALIVCIMHRRGGELGREKKSI